MKRLLACVICAFASQATAAAHVLDEYVQAAQITLAPSGARVEIRLVPGVEVANRIFRMIDLDHDGQISAAEQQAYAQRVLLDIALEVDGRRAPLALAGVEFPSRREMNEGIGAIRLNLASEAPLDMTGEHQLSFRNYHLPKLSVYLINAVVPSSSEIKISGQTRDPLQHEMRLSFHVNPHVSTANTEATKPWTGALWKGALMVGVCLVLLFPVWKQLRQNVRRRHDEQIPDSAAR